MQKKKTFFAYGYSLHNLLLFYDLRLSFHRFCFNKKGYFQNALLLSIWSVSLLFIYLFIFHLFISDRNIIVKYWRQTVIEKKKSHVRLYNTSTVYTLNIWTSKLLAVQFVNFEPVHCTVCSYVYQLLGEWQREYTQIRRRVSGV